MWVHGLLDNLPMLPIWLVMSQIWSRKKPAESWPIKTSHRSHYPCTEWCQICSVNDRDDDPPHVMQLCFQWAWNHQYTLVVGSWVVPCCSTPTEVMIIKNLKKYFTFEVRLKNDVAVMGRLSPKMFFNMMLVGHGNVPHVGWGRDGQDTDTKGTKSTKKGELSMNHGPRWPQQGFR